MSGNDDLSILTLITHASLVVKLVMTLLIGSLLSFLVLDLPQMDRRAFGAEPHRDLRT